MLGNFSYCNPTKLYFGDESLKYLNDELPKYGANVVLIYGGGSIRKNGIYDEVIGILEKNGKNVAEISGVMPNPTVDKLYEGVEIARKHNADMLLAVGGGSVCDYAKAVSVSVHCGEDPWEKYYVRFEEPTCETLPVGCVLTMVGTGSEMNAGAVITNPHTHQKIGHVFADEKIMPRFAILNPKYTLTLPHYQMIAGIYDIFNHICEQYFSGEDDNTSDYISEEQGSPGLRGEEQSDVGCHMGAEYAGIQRKVNGLDGAHARPVRGRLHKRHPRHDAGSGIPSVLPSYPALRRAEVQALRRQCMGCGR